MAYLSRDLFNKPDPLTSAVDALTRSVVEACEDDAHPFGCKVEVILTPHNREIEWRFETVKAPARSPFKRRGRHPDLHLRLLPFRVVMSEGELAWSTTEFGVAGEIAKRLRPALESARAYFHSDLWC